MLPPALDRCVFPEELSLRYPQHVLATFEGLCQIDRDGYSALALCRELCIALKFSTSWRSFGIDPRYVAASLAIMNIEL